VGGLNNAAEIDIETGVPVISKIPLLNRFFTSRGASREKELQLILVRPEIIIRDEELTGVD